jgi:YD repeat-containing protein
VAKIFNDKTSALFTYKDNQLIAVTNGYQNTYTYEYGPQGLAKVQYPDKTAKRINYNATGQVISFQNRKGCLETYQSLANQDREVVKVCSGQETARDRYTFKKHKVVKYVHHTSEGFINSEYDLTCQKIKKTTRRQQADFSDLAFTYNAKCQVVGVQDFINKDKYSVTYNQQGIVQTITKNQEVMKIEYNDQKKPIKVSHSKLGTLQVVYSNNTGKILEVYPVNTVLAQELSKAASLIEQSESR